MVWSILREQYARVWSNISKSSTRKRESLQRIISIETLEARQLFDAKASFTESYGPPDVLECKATQDLFATVKVEDDDGSYGYGLSSSYLLNLNLDGDALIGTDYLMFYETTSSGDKVPYWGGGITVTDADNYEASIYIQILEDSDPSDKLKESVSLTLSAGSGYELADTDPEENVEEVVIKDIQRDSKEYCPCECGEEGQSPMMPHEDESSLKVKALLDIAGEGFGTFGNLLYNSLFNPHPIINAKADIPEFSGTQPSIIEATFNYENGLVTQTKYFEYDPLQAGQKGVFGFLINDSELALTSGDHLWTVTLRYGDEVADVFVELSGAPVDELNGIQTYLNRKDSEFGNRWGLEGFDRLRFQGGDVFLETGLGNGYLFQADGNGGFIRQAGESGNSTLVYDSGKYFLEDKLGNRDTFDEDGNLIERRDAQGNRLTLTYTFTLSDQYERIEILNSANQVMSYDFTYDIDGSRTLTITDVAGRETLLEFDEDNLLTKLLGPEASDTSRSLTLYEYDPTTLALLETNQYRLMPLDAEPGTLISRSIATYDPDTLRLTSLEQVGLDSVKQVNGTVASGLPGEGTGEITDPYTLKLASNLVGTRTQYESGESITFTTNEFGQTTSETSTRGTTFYFYNSDGKLLQIIEPDLDVSNLIDERRFTDFTYDSLGNMLTMSITLGAVTKSQAWTYNAQSRVTQETDFDGRITIYDWSVEGNLNYVTRVVDEIGGVDDVTTTYTYSTAQTYDSMTGLATSIPGGLLLSMTDAEGHVTTYEYYDETDALTGKFLGKLAKVTLPILSSELTAPFQSFTYDVYGNLDLVTDELGRVTDYDYESSGKLSSVTLPDPDGAGALISPIYSYTYDQWTRISSAIVPNPATGLNDYHIQYQYGVDTPNKLRFTKIIEVDHPQSTLLEPVTTTEYYDANRNLVKVVDTLGRVTQSVYSAEFEEQLNGMTLPDPDGMGPLTSPTSTLVYDVWGRVSSILSNRAQLEYSAPEFDDLVVPADTSDAFLDIELERLDVPGVSNATDLLRFEITGITGINGTTVPAAIYDRVQIVQVPGALPKLHVDFHDDEVGDVVFTLRAIASDGTASDPFTVTVERDSSGTVDDTPATVAGPFRVLGITPGANLLGGVSSIVVNFSDVLDATAADTAWFSLARLALGGSSAAVTITSAVLLSRTQVLLTFTEQTTAGEYTLTVDEAITNAADAELDQDRDEIEGEATDAYHGFFTIAPGANLGTNSEVSGLIVGQTTTYDLLERVTSETDALGNTTTYTYDNELVLLSEVYDELGLAELYDTWELTEQKLRHVTITGPGAGTDNSEAERVYDFYYDELDRLAIVIQPLVYNAIVDDDERPATIYQYDRVGNLLKSIDVLGTDLSEDRELRTTEYEYDERDRLTKVILPILVMPSTVTKQLSTEYLYDVAGQLLLETTSIDSSNNDWDGVLSQTGYLYDALGRTIKVVMNDPTTGVAAEIDSGDQNLIEIAADAIVYGYEYTITGQIAREISPNPTTGLTYSGTNQSDLTPVTGIIATAYTYDAAGRLVAVTEADPDGAGDLEAPVTEYEYDAVGNLLQVTDPTGRTTDYVYDDLDRLLSVTLAEGTADEATTEYAYDEAGNLFSVTDALGRTTYFVYDALGRAVHTIDALGGIWTTDFDEAGRTAREIDALGRQTAYIYDALDRLRDVNRPLANAAGTRRALTYTYDLASNITELLEVTGYDEFDNEIVRTTKSFYDSWNRLTAVHLPDPTTGAASSGNDWTYAYYEALGLTIVTDPLNRQSATLADKLGRTVSSFAAHASTGVAVTLSGTTITASGPQTDYVYDVLGRLTDTLLPDPDDGGDLARPRYHTDYDDLGRVIRSIAPNPTADSTVDTYAGYAVYPVGHGSAGEPVTGAGVTSYEYDAAGRLTRQLSPTFTADVSGTPTDARLSTVYTYDHQGRLYETAAGAVEAADLNESLATDQVTRYVRDLVGNVTSTVRLPGETLEQVHQTTYDRLNRALSQTDPRDAQTTFAYDAMGNLLALTDPAGNTTAWEYDRRDRSIRETNQLGYARLFEYDDIDRLTSKIDRTGRTTEYEYDALDRLTSEIWKDLSDDVVGSYDYTYDLANQLESVARDAATQNYYVYDQRGNVLLELQYVMYLPFQHNNTYDNLDRRTHTETRAPMWGIYGYSFTERDYTYDALSRITSILQSDMRTALGGGPPGVSDPYGANAQRVTLEYNSLGQKTLLSRFTTDYDTDPANYVWHGVADSIYTYDPLARLTTLEHAATSMFTGYLDSRINEFGYEYDDLNRITQKSSIDGTSEYTYDGAGQLVATDHTGTYQADDEGYEFDLNGNRLDVTGGGGGTSTYVIGPNNEILDDGVYTYTYDREGNRLTKFRKTPTSTYDDYTFYTYDHRNRLVDVSFYDGDDPENDTLLIQRVYRYDYLDRRVSVTNPLDSSMASQQRYAYDGLDIVFECTGLNSGWYFYTMGYNFWVPDGENSLLLTNEVYVGYMLRPSLIHWTFSDAQQTTTDIVQSNDEGTEFHRLNHIVYDSTGNTVATWHHTGGWGGPTDHLFTRYLYTGMERDWLTGLYAADHRWYDPKLGKWINHDPIGFAGGQWNVSMYVGNDPVNYTDPSGLDAIILFDPNARAAGTATVGHPALLVGDDNKGWQYFSFHAGNGLTNTDNLERERFKTLKDAKSANILSTYEEYIRVTTTPERDKITMDNADKWASKDYHLGHRNCCSMVSLSFCSHTSGLSLYTNRTFPTTWWAELKGDAAKAKYEVRSWESTGRKPTDKIEMDGQEQRDAAIKAMDKKRSDWEWEHYLKSRQRR
jgi:RHS repeat-associated protein